MAKKTMVYTGTYQTQFWASDIHRPRGGNFTVLPHGIGICRYEFDPDTGELTPQGHTYVDNNPATMWVSPDQRILYAAHETKNFDGVSGAGGGVSAFAINQENGALTHINTVSSCGTFTCFVTADRTGKFVIAANHSSTFYNTVFEKQKDGDYRPKVLCDIGSLALFCVRADGGLEEACDVIELPPKRFGSTIQAPAHPHAVKITPGDLVIAPNKGSDTVDVFKLDKENKRLIPLENFPANPGSAPRHLVIHPTRPYFFVLNESNNKVVSYGWRQETGRIYEIGQAFTVPPQFVRKQITACDIAMHPSGRYIYTTNYRPFFSIAAFRIEQETGRMTHIGNFREDMAWFREFKVDPTGRYLVGGSMQGDRMMVFEIDQDTGWLQLVGAGQPASYPSCIAFVEIGG